MAKALFYLNRKAVFKEIENNITRLKKSLEMEEKEDKKEEIFNKLEKARTLKNTIEKVITDFEISEKAILSEIKADHFISLLSYDLNGTDHKLDSDLVEAMEKAVATYKSNRRTDKEGESFKEIRTAIERVISKENTRKSERYHRSRFGWNNALTYHIIYISENCVKCTEYGIDKSINDSALATEIIRCLIMMLRNPLTC